MDKPLGMGISPQHPIRVVSRLSAGFVGSVRPRFGPHTFVRENKRETEGKANAQFASQADFDLRNGVYYFGKYSGLLRAGHYPTVGLA
jgi:hypothetical protein